MKSKEDQPKDVEEHRDMETLFFLRYGEVALKSKAVRKQMVQKLRANIKDACKRRGITFDLRPKRLHLVVSTHYPDELEPILAHTFGVYSYSRLHLRPLVDMETLLNDAEEHFAPYINDSVTFAVRAKRDKRYPFSTQEIERTLGARLVPYGGRVNLKHPDITCSLDLRDDRLYLYAEKTRGPAGLPLGVEPPVLTLISGGFDSPVAAWSMMKRGVPTHFIFFELGGFAQRGAIYAHLHQLYQQWCFGHRPKLMIIPGRPIIETLQEHVPQRYRNVMLKRTFYQVGKLLANAYHHSGLVTGESIAQVSSQTISNLYSISSGIDIPSFRPLLTFEKDEIIKLSRKIGTHDIAANVQEYCAITPKKPATRTKVETVQELEEAIGGMAFYQSLVEQKETISVDSLDPNILTYLNVITDTIPKDAVLVDMREPPSPIGTPTLQCTLESLLSDPQQLSQDKTYLLFCDGGMQSAEAASILREFEINAFAFEGGIHRLRKRLPSPQQEQETTS
ncbi:MAG TPA: tRNA 4-thiouridine(8) synthase ThiI [Myxococcales bacterium]|nr:tRNA 4-thiouridine(8) synthase ThiI [Myxococcales bacterium]